MAMTPCGRGHYYDPAKHSSCPHCGVRSLDINFTQPKQAEGYVPERTMPLQPGSAAAPGQAGNPQRGTEGERTVGIYRKKMGFDPVVGWLVCIEGNDRGRDYRIHSEKNFIGRSERMDIHISGDDTISRENHAAVSFNPKKGTFRFHAGDGKGLVYVNGEQVDTSVELSAYDIIEMGQTRLVFMPFCGERFQWES
ncbi:FHA domain-containing protein [Heliobacterium undosum]|uniref:FHA domain-containing protein n=1 Tax=Heliomicrobium undosum TaxID=121734 RepID=A0A845L587_9FIRM|nr:FHA domain-containing protein [Heliomicrobium undosum]MZP29820.1 FHA domain-containing protein [Heliomicrobium undosum]